MSDLTAQIAELVNKTNELVGKFSDWDIDSISTKVTTLETSVSNINLEISNLKTNDTILNNKIINLNSRVTNIEENGVPSSNTLPAPILSGADTLQENTSITNTITNYDSDATYTITSSDENILTASRTNDTITITAGDITDGSNKTATLTVQVSKSGYNSNQTQKSFVITVITTTTETAYLWEGNTLTEDNLSDVEGGYVA